ncbi:hypothetical protein KUTeg_011758 [Tegillarca granosa]|uniref:Phospholipid-transporting ATPase n=1 Tax=Tegillarca granosa TaxID=220873 RepID=A0ABQ9EXK4_TEGGR|nr:hypothetical protein KUTeg_011758 [Tegillarca granosa]
MSQYPYWHLSDEPESGPAPALMSQYPDKHLSDKPVGDIVKVEINHSFPCDLVMLSSSDPEGSCYVTTANLDGETNLKNFTCLAETKLYQTEESFDKLHAYIECEQPKTDLYSFIGKINIVTDNGHICDKSLGPENVLLRGARLRNTAFVYGKKLNTFLIIFLVILLLESLVSVFLKYWYISLPNIGKPWYVPTSSREDGLNPRSVIENFLAYMVIYNYIIPISMYVTTELHKFFGSLYFGWDLQMYDEATDQPARANTSDLNEELGQPELENFFTVLVLCHTCRVDYPEAHATGAATGAATMYSHTGMDYEYQASSPDEKAFLEACRRYGIVYHGQHEGRLEVTFKGEMRRYKLLHVLDFDPTRKRMSVIIQNEQDEIYLLCKGAESAVLNRAHSGDTHSTLQHVDEYALLGLRTLVISSRRFTEQEYQKINNQLKEARIAMENREQKLADAFDEIEQNLNILGATAVEDKLQEDVPKTISSLQRAGIMVWVLTGDKEETAINISHSAGHFKRGMVELKLTKITDTNVCAEQITQHIKTIMTAASAQQFALVIDGMTLALAIPEHQKLLRDLCQLCVSVLCCRMSPLQKAEVCIECHECHHYRKLRFVFVWVIDGMTLALAIPEHQNLLRDLCQLCVSVLCCRMSSLQKAEVCVFVWVIDGMTLALAIPEHQKLLRDLCQLCVSVLCCRMSPLQKAEVCVFVWVIDGMTLALAIPEHQKLLRDLCQLCVSVLCCRMSPLQKAEVCICQGD